MTHAIQIAFRFISGALASPTAVMLIDFTALLVALIPSFYYGSRILVGASGGAQELVQSRKTLSRLTLLCVVVVLLQFLKVPVVIKAVAGIIVIFVALFLVFEANS